MMKRKDAPRTGSGEGRWRLGGAGRKGDMLYAVLVHLGFLTILVVSFEWTSTPRPAAQQPVEVIKAVAVDETKVQREMDRLQQAEARKQAEQQERERQAREQARRAEAERKREEQRLAAVKQQQEEAARRLAAERERVEQEKRTAAELARKKQEEATRLAELQQQQKAEAERLAALQKQQAEIERQRRAEEERRKQAEEERRRQLAEQLAAEEQRIAAEEQRIAAEREARAQSEIDRYVEIIKQKVARNWIKPPKWDGLKCTVLVNLMPGGEVLNVQIAQGSGDAVFDTSVERAVRKASPLPLPSDRSLFDRFRELKFVFEPKE